MGFINIYGTIKSMTGDGKAVCAEQTFDTAKGKFQSVINEERQKESEGDNVSAYIYAFRNIGSFNDYDSLNEKLDDICEMTLGGTPDLSDYIGTCRAKVNGVNIIIENFIISWGSGGYTKSLLQTVRGGVMINNSGVVSYSEKVRTLYRSYNDNDGASEWKYQSWSEIVMPVTLTDAEKQQARENIGAVSVEANQIVFSQLVDLRTKDNYITKNIGFINGTFDNAMTQCADATLSGDKALGWLILTYGSSGSESIAMVHQTHGDTTTEQVVYYGNYVKKRTITFTNSNRVQVDTIGSWSTLTSLFGVQSTNSTVVLRMMNPLLDKDAGLYRLTIPAATQNNSGVMTTELYNKLINLESRVAALEE